MLESTQAAARFAPPPAVSPAESPVSLSGSPPRSRLVARVESLLDRGSRTRRLLSITVPAPLAEPAALFAALPGRRSMLWAAGADAVAGVGVARRLAGTGAGRLRQVRHQARRAAARSLSLSSGFGSVGSADGPGPAPRFYGGLAFAPRHPGAPTDAWDPWGDADFVLPRWLYRRPSAMGGPAALTLSACGEDLTSAGRRRLVGELVAILDALEGSPLDGPLDGPLGVASARRLDGGDPDRWHRLVDAALGEIADGRFAKVVLARASRWRLDGVASGLDAVRRLDHRPPPAVGARFAFGRPGEDGRRWLLGQTPEHLVTLRGLEVTTEALAGTLGASAPDQLGAGWHLLESVKDRREHAWVVRAITAALAPLCRRLEVSTEPQLLRLPGLTHLQTPIRGRLRRRRHVLDLVAALHPTPAVGGFPSAEAGRWLAQHEDLRRGWYAAPVGWFDTAGDGELAVALRCGLLETGPRGLELRTFAGAGLVAGSRADLEWRETELKQNALLAHLGLSGPDHDLTAAPESVAAGGVS